MFIKQQRSLFPWAHVRVNGNTIVCGIAELFLTNLCTAEKVNEEQY